MKPIKPPLTPDTFASKNLSLISKVLPEVVTLDQDNSGPSIELIGRVEDRVWGVMGEDPMLKRLGRDGYNDLPEGQRLQILEDALTLLDATQEADKFLKEK